MGKKKDKKSKPVEEEMDEFDLLLAEADEDDEEEDEFDRLLREASDDEDEEEPVANEVPECERTGQHELDGQSNCVHCSLHIEAEPEVKRKRGERKPGEPRAPMMSGHCAYPQSQTPEESHLRCYFHGSGNTAVPDKVFAPCPCLCHLDDAEYECSICGRPIFAAPYWTGEYIDPTDLDMVTFVHVVNGRAQEE